MAEVAALADTLAHGSKEERVAAAESLARLAEKAQPAAVAIVQALEIDDDQLRDWLVAALEGLGAPDAGDLPELAALVARPNLDSAYWATTLLGRLNQEAAAAVPQLADAVQQHAESAVRERAAWALGQIGPSAAAARPTLEKAAAEGGPRLARLANQALSQIGG